MSDEFDMQDDDGHIDNSDLDFRSGKRARDDDDEDHEPVDEEEPEEELVIQVRFRHTGSKYSIPCWQRQRFDFPLFFLFFFC